MNLLLDNGIADTGTLKGGRFARKSWIETGRLSSGGPVCVLRQHRLFQADDIGSRRHRFRKQTDGRIGAANA